MIGLYNAERPYPTHGILTSDEAYASKIEPPRLVAWHEALIHINKDAKRTNYQDHLSFPRSHVKDL
jgi:hypothetical protein